MVNDVGAVFLLAWLTVCAVLWLFVGIVALADAVGAADDA